MGHLTQITFQPVVTPLLPKAKTLHNWSPSHQKNPAFAAFLKVLQLQKCKLESTPKFPVRCQKNPARPQSGLSSPSLEQVRERFVRTSGSKCNGGFITKFKLNIYDASDAFRMSVAASPQSRLSFLVSIQLIRMKPSTTKICPRP